MPVLIKLMKPQKTLIPLCIILVLSLSYSCKTDAERQSAEQIVSEWIGRKKGGTIVHTHNRIDNHAPPGLPL